MKIVLENLLFCREHWSLSGQGIFEEGTHLITGDTGSGKSTLALLLAGLLKPARGRVTREDINTIMVSFQFPEYHVTGSTVLEECSSWGIDPDDTLAKVNLCGKKDLAPLRLSRGELKRLHLACVLASRYDLLVLDEPFSSLDCREKERICSEISGRTEGITILFTHEQEYFPRVDWIWEIGGGSLIFRGPVPGALRSWSHVPEGVKKLVERGRIPHNLTPADLREAACRM